MLIAAETALEGVFTTELSDSIRLASMLSAGFFNTTSISASGSVLSAGTSLVVSNTDTLVSGTGSAAVYVEPSTVTDSYISAAVVSGISDTAGMFSVDDTFAALSSVTVALDTALTERVVGFGDGSDGNAWNAEWRAAAPTGEGTGESLFMFMRFIRRSKASLRAFLSGLRRSAGLSV